MPRNGTGGYNLPNNSWNPAINGASATAGDWQALINDVAAAIQNSVSADGQTTMTGSLNMGGFVVTALGSPSGAGQSLRWEQLTKGADIASASNIAIPIEGSLFSVTGTTQIDTITDVYPGRIAYLLFAGALVLKNSANLTLPGGRDILTVAGDLVGVLNEAPGVWRVISAPTRVSVQSGLLKTGGFKNKLINGQGLVNQRAVIGTVVLAAGAYGHDRFKAGSGGCTYTYSTTNGIVTFNISAGSLIQIVEGVAIFSGDHTLSWLGTSQGRIGAVAFADSPVSAALTGGTNASVEFGIGTLSLPQLEEGTYATPFEIRPPGVELELTQRYFFRWFIPAGATMIVSAIAGTGDIREYLTLPVPMRGAVSGSALPPTGFEIYNGTAWVALNFGGAVLQNQTTGIISLFRPASVAFGDTTVIRNTTATNGQSFLFDSEL